MSQSKRKEEYRPCQYCGSGIPLSKSQCTSCNQFDIDDAIEEEGKDGILSITETREADYPNRISTGPWDINFGTHYDDDGNAFSGLVDTTLSLIGGKNGSGKSTLVTHIINEIIDSSHKLNKEECVIWKKKSHPNWKLHEKCHRRHALYISAEEPTNSIRARLKRLGYKSPTLDHFLIVPLGTNINVDAALERYSPCALIGDSISKIASDERAVEWCDKPHQRCERLRMPGLLINHINKDGDQAGFEALQHTVDAVFLFTIDTDKVRIFETVKNRNGEDGIKTLYRMTGKGLKFDPIATAEANGNEDDEETDNSNSDDSDFDDEAE